MKYYGALLVSCVVATQAFADEAAVPQPPPPPLSATVTVASQYISRGVRQTWGRPALQAGVDYADPSGWSAGTWISTIDDRFVEKGTVEWDLYGGYTSAVGDVGYSVILYRYLYPGALITATNTRSHYTELSLGLTYKSAYAKYNYTLSRDFFGIIGGRHTGYLDVGMNYDMGGGYTLNLHGGDGRVAGAGNDFWDWRDAKVGVTRAFDGGWSGALALTRAWGRTDAYSHYTTGAPNSAGVVEYANVQKATLVLSVTKTF